ncbi:MAG TPA: hypothetical protein VGN98_00805, partial [Tianweitania sediminis]|nr:hypothetical protein [Tianweitania sediminis]
GGRISIGVSSMSSPPRKGSCAALLPGAGKKAAFGMIHVTALPRSGCSKLNGVRISTAGELELPISPAKAEANQRRFIVPAPRTMTKVS